MQFPKEPNKPFLIQRSPGFYRGLIGFLVLLWLVAGSFQLVRYPSNTNGLQLVLLFPPIFLLAGLLSYKISWLQERLKALFYLLAASISGWILLALVASNLHFEFVSVCFVLFAAISLGFHAVIALRNYMILFLLGLTLASFLTANSIITLALLLGSFVVVAGILYFLLFGYFVAAEQAQNSALVGHRLSAQLNQREVELTLTIEQLTQISTKLQASQEELNRFFLVTPDMFTLLNRKGEMSLLNPAWQQLLGYPLESISQQSVLELIHPEEKDAFGQLLQNLFQKTQQTGITCRVRHQNGHYRWFDWKVRSVPEDRVVYCSVRDITEQQKLEGAYRKLAVVAEKTQNAVIITDAQGFTTWVNQAFIDITGFTLEEMLDKKPGELLQGPLTNPETVREMSQRLKMGQPFAGEIYNYTKDRKGYWLDLSINPIRDQRGDIEGFIAIESDISERKEREKAQIHQQERMQEIYSISMSNADGSQQFQRLLLSAATNLGMEVGIISRIEDGVYHIIEGLSSTQTGNKLSAQALPVAALPSAITFVQGGIVAKSTFVDLGNGYNIAFFDNSFPVSAYIGALLVVNGKPFGTLDFFSSSPRKSAFSQADYDFVQLLGQWVCTALERQTYEQQLILAKEKAEQASLAKAQFLSIMSHEIRTPMNAVIGLTHLLLQENPRPNQLENLKVLKFSAEHLLILINDILDLNRVESGKLELEEIPFNLTEMIQSIQQSFALLIKEKGISLHIEVDNEIPRQLIGDPVRLAQVLTNLVGNAIKFTERGGVTLKVKHLINNDKQVKIHFSVTDTGIGIPPDKQEVIFESFTQASSATTRKYGGTGLGLAITKKLLELFGSKIALNSQPGKGSEFSFELSFELPVEENGHQGADLIAHHFYPLKGKKILLVDDNPINILVARKFLHLWQAETALAESGHEAIEKVAQEHFDLILMDIQMPEMDGIETTRKIRQMPGCDATNLPIVALTASVMHELKDKVLNSGMNDYISKPIVPERLNAVVWKQLQKYDRAKTKAQKINTTVPQIIKN